MGTTFFRTKGISPVSSDLLHIRKMGLANDYLHIFKSRAGNLSGPAAAVDEIYVVLVGRIRARNC